MEAVYLTGPPEKFSIANCIRPDLSRRKVEPGDRQRFKSTEEM
jgi:hypothetical protein